MFFVTTMFLICHIQTSSSVPQLDSVWSFSRSEIDIIERSETGLVSPLCIYAYWIQALESFQDTTVDCWIRIEFVYLAYLLR